MNKKDLLIIANLRNDARMPLTKMSRKIQIPVSTIFDRLKTNNKGVIRKHTCLLDFSQLGYNVRANIAFKADREDKEALKQHLISHCSVNSVCRINNGFDFMIEGIFKQIKDMEEFLDNIEKDFRILDKKTFFIIEDLKKEAFMSNPDMVFGQ